MDYEPVPVVSKEPIDSSTLDRQREYYNYNYEKGPVYIGEDSEVVVRFIKRFFFFFFALNQQIYFVGCSYNLTTFISSLLFVYLFSYSHYNSVLGRISNHEFLCFRTWEFDI